MTDTGSPGVRPRIPAPSGATSGATRKSPEPTGWVGWIVFGAVMMVTVGLFHAFEGFIALFKDSYYLVAKSGLVVSVDYTAWGWVHILAGLVMAGTGVALFTGKMWARVMAVVVALLSVLVNFAFMSAYPWWSALMIAIDVLVIYAVTVHGREMQSV
jgi:hypothetical protein